MPKPLMCQRLVNTWPIGAAADAPMSGNIGGPESTNQGLMAIAPDTVRRRAAIVRSDLRISNSRRP